MKKAEIKKAILKIKNEYKDFKITYNCGYLAVFIEQEKILLHTFIGFNFHSLGNCLFCYNQKQKQDIFITSLN